MEIKDHGEVAVCADEVTEFIVGNPGRLADRHGIGRLKGGSVQLFEEAMPGPADSPPSASPLPRPIAAIWRDRSKILILFDET